MDSEALDALARLDEITRRLRRECPWDREQDERSIVPHTIEEAYELADAAASGEDAKLIDELGDVLFAAVSVARKLRVDPELALRAASERFRARVEAAAALAESEQQRWDELPPERQLGYYERAADALDKGGAPA